MRFSTDPMPTCRRTQTVTPIALHRQEEPSLRQLKCAFGGVADVRLWGGRRANPRVRRI